MIAGWDWTLEQWEALFEKEEAQKTDGNKCHCSGSYYRHVLPEDRINKSFNWECMKCNKQFYGT